MLVNKTSFLLLLVLLGLCIFSYYPSLYAPFYIDDFGSIVGNQKLINYNIPHLWDSYGLRFIGYLSFALNSEHIGTEAFDYRIVNITIHCLVSFSVFVFLRLLLTTY